MVQAKDDAVWGVWYHFFATIHADRLNDADRVIGERVKRIAIGDEIGETAQKGTRSDRSGALGHEPEGGRAHGEVLLRVGFPAFR